MEKRLIEWAVTKRGTVNENFGMGQSMGQWADKDAGLGVGAPDMRAGMEEVGCGCGCQGCGSDCGCECCAQASGHACPDCGKALMVDADVCDECSGGGLSWGGEYLDEDDATMAGDADDKTQCDACGAPMADEATCCDECGNAPMLESLLREKKKRKGPSKATQKKIAKSWMKKGDTFEEKEEKAEEIPGIEDPAAFVAWAEKTATGKYPSQKKKK